MDDEQDSLHVVLHADHTVLVATTLATLFLAGSALICRSGRRLSSRQSYSAAPSTSQGDSQDKIQSADDSTKNSARSKERRRRGKDPLKEILKNGKKLKMLTVSRDVDTGSSVATSAASSPLPLVQISESSNADSGSQRSASVSTVSTSRSVSAGSSHAAVTALGMTDIHPRNRDSEHADASMESSSIQKAPEPETGPLLEISENTESSSLISGDSPADKSSSDSAVLLTSASSQTKPVYTPNPWDWDGQGQSVAAANLSGTAEPAAYRKPPRFQTKSPFASAVASSSRAVASSEDLSFIASTSSGSPHRATTPRTNSAPNSGGNTGRASPASGASEGSQLTTQTQLASLRGALEAARMREEKARGEIERYAKDAEMMRWENGAWRRRGSRAQIHHLMHQLQGYAALFHTQAQVHNNHQHMPNGSGSPGPSSPSSPLPNGQYPPPNGYPYPAAAPYPLPPMPGVFSPPMMSPGQQPPYFAAYPMPGPPPPPPIPPQPPQQQPPQPQQQQPSTLFAMLFPGAGAKSGTTGAGGSAGARSNGSVSGSSTGSGSGSPDLVGSPALAPALVARGRRRTRTQTAEARLGNDVVEGWVGIEHEHELGEMPEYAYDGREHYQAEEGEYGGEGYDANGDGHGYGYEYGEGDEDDTGFSDVLADAILKRPESMRREKEREEAPTEFTFPSLSDFGPGVQQGGDKQRGDESGAVQPEEAGTRPEEESTPVPLENTDSTATATSLTEEQS
ncbi:hypothetical protein MSAN_02386200 [Mycena sanguinolenta]|uniref:Uncharacterized protein n=1 Tax=Mycena sanguinolenta TaxID=230812 RepID=A0A8H6X4D3_9AGAR|nr:hypothetical protein MSAN_02386200 [Mycena sanguinolenta]